MHSDSIGLALEFLLTARMPQTMVEAFARGLVDKIMLEALGLLDTNAENGKYCISQEDDAERMSDAEATQIAIQAQIHDESRADYSQQEAAAAIAKMVCGLRNVHIGDSFYVLPPVLSNLERQVKRAAGAIGLHSALGRSSDPSEVRVTQGQGDVDQAMQNAAFDAPIELESSSTTQRKEKEASGGEATKVSLGLLHRMIEELESESVSSQNNTTDVPDAVKERIGDWEEREERLVRVIECVRSESQEAGREDEEPLCFLLEEDETRCALMRQLRDNCFEEVAIGEATPPGSPAARPASSNSPPPPPTRQPRSVPAESDILRADEPQRDSGGAKRKSKRRDLAARVKKLFAAAFRRRKHH